MKRSSYIAIIGKTNVGKSTTSTHYQEKVTITSKKTQTTKKIKYFFYDHDKDTQMVFITPALETKIKRLKKELSKRPKEALENIDLVIAVVAGTKFDKTDKKVFEIIENVNSKKSISNKQDIQKNKKDLFLYGKIERRNAFDAKYLFNN